MSLIDRAIVKVKRGESPFWRFVKSVLRAMTSPTLPPLPRFILPPFRWFYEFRILMVNAWRFVATVFYRHPTFQARCASIGHRVRLDGLPFISGHTQIHVGNDCHLGGGICISSGGVFDQPKLVIEDRSSIGWNTTFTVNREIVIEEDVLISYNCNISDTDGHRREADLRVQGVPLRPEDTHPVRICKKAWIGNGSYILKGVTIGEGAIIGANSVVMTNIPPYTLALGNPAEVFMRNYGLPSTHPRKRKRTPREDGEGSA